MIAAASTRTPMNVVAALETRLSHANLDAAATIELAEIQELVRLAQEAPSSFNIQFTRYLAVTDNALKVRLREASLNQVKITDAAAVFVLLGDLEAHVPYAERMRAAAAAGHVPQAMADYLVGMATRSYSVPAAAREESARSVGLSGMALMLAAEERGWASCPMIGFDPNAYRTILGYDERYVALLVVAVGKAGGPGARKRRLPVDAVLRVNRGDF